MEKKAEKKEDAISKGKTLILIGTFNESKTDYGQILKQK